MKYEKVLISFIIDTRTQSLYHWASADVASTSMHCSQSLSVHERSRHLIV